MSATWKKALADVTRRKGRTLLVVLGIFVAVFGLVGLTITEDTVSSALAYSVGGHQPDVVVGVKTLDAALLPALRGTTNVTAVQYQTSFLTHWHIRQAPGLLPLAIDSRPDLRHVPINPFQLIAGRLPHRGEIVMEYSDLGLQSFAIGDQMTVDGAWGPVRLRVVGTVRTPGVNPAASGRALGYMSDAGLQHIDGMTAGTTTNGLRLSYAIDIAVRNVAHAPTTATTITHVLRVHRTQVLDVSLPGAIDPSAIQALHGVFSLLRILTLLAAVMSGFLILNTVSTLIVEQTAIIGTMKAIGGTRAAIMRGYLLSVGLYSLLATLSGMTLGLFGGYALAVALAPTVPLAIGSFTLPPEVIPLGLAVGFGVPLLAALLPLWTGTRITVREALSAYGVSAGQGGGLLSRVSRRMTWVPQTVWLGLDGVVRKPWRTALTLLTLCVASICFLTVQTAASSVQATVASVYRPWDADVVVHMPALPLNQARALLRVVPNVRRVDRYAEGSTTTPWGHLDLWGIDPTTRIYRYRLTSGRWLRPGDSNVVLLSVDAAATSGLKIGGTLTVSAGGGTRTWTIIGTVDQTTDTIGGLGAAVTTTDALYQLQGIEQAGQTNLATEVMIQAGDRSGSAVARLTNSVNAAVNGAPAGPASGGAVVARLADVSRRHQQSWNVLYLLLYIAALIVGAAGLVGLANALITSVLERRREIGMWRAMGATGGRVAQVFWTEGLILGGFAWIVSAVCGILPAYTFVRYVRQTVLPTTFVMDASAFLVMLAAIVAMTTLASTLSAARASRMRIADILRYE